MVYVMGDLNAKVGQEQHNPIVGKHKLGQKWKRLTTSTIDPFHISLTENPKRGYSCLNSSTL